MVSVADAVEYAQEVTAYSIAPHSVLEVFDEQRQRWRIDATVCLISVMAEDGTLSNKTAWLVCDSSHIDVAFSLSAQMESYISDIRLTYGRAKNRRRYYEYPEGYQNMTLTEFRATALKSCFSVDELIANSLADRTYDDVLDVYNAHKRVSNGDADPVR